MVTTNLRKDLRSVLWSPSPTCALQKQVDAELVRQLQAHGFRNPVANFCDPRLDYPELLLMSGYEYSAGEGGSRYTYYCDDDSYNQAIQYGAEHSRTIITHCGQREQSVTGR